MSDGLTGIDCWSRILAAVCKLHPQLEISEIGREPRRRRAGHGQGLVDRQPHGTGPLIRSKNGFWLAIPTPAAGKSTRGGRITPGEWERRRGLRLRFVYRRTGSSMLAAEGRLNTKGQAVVSRSKTGRGKAER